MESWITAGFQPVSMNNAAEIEQLTAAFPEVEFLQASRDATGIAGKPMIFVDDLFAAMASCGEAVTGLVNSDILLRSSSNLPDLFRFNAANGLVFGSRIDIDQPQDCTGELYRIGYDYFFMDAETARNYPPTILSMGAPMWDYWAVLIPILRGRTCRYMNKVCAYHVRHERHWDNRLNIRMMKEIIDHSGIEFEGVEAVDFSNENIASKKLLGQFAVFILQFLEAHSKPVFRGPKFMPVK